MRFREYLSLTVLKLITRKKPRSSHYGHNPYDSPSIGSSRSRRDGWKGLNRDNYEKNTWIRIQVQFTKESVFLDETVKGTGTLTEGIAKIINALKI